MYLLRPRRARKLFLVILLAAVACFAFNIFYDKGSLETIDPKRIQDMIGKERRIRIDRKTEVPKTRQTKTNYTDNLRWEMVCMYMIISISDGRESEFIRSTSPTLAVLPINCFHKSPVLAMLICVTACCLPIFSTSFPARNQLLIIYTKPEQMRHLSRSTAVSKQLETGVLFTWHLSIQTSSVW